MSLKRLNSVKSLARLNSVKNLAKMVRGGLGSFQSKGKNIYRSLSADSLQAGYLGKKGSCSSRDDEIPEGSLAVYVGDERRRFVIPTVYLSHPIFLMLLDKAREEYGFKQKEGLTVPCDVEVFEESLWLIECSQSASGQFDLELLVSSFLNKSSLSPNE